MDALDPLADPPRDDDASAHAHPDTPDRQGALAVADLAAPPEIIRDIPRQIAPSAPGRSTDGGSGPPVVSGDSATGMVVPVVPPGGKRSVPPARLVQRPAAQASLPGLGTDRVPTFVPAFSRRLRFFSTFFALCWFGTLLLCWPAWFRPAEVRDPSGFLGFLTLLGTMAGPGVYFVIAGVRPRRVNPQLPVADLRVAFVVTKAPSEPWDVVRETLSGMLCQNFPYRYDVWVCDEDPSTECYQWCEARGVGVSTRKGFRDYHRPEWPRRTRCKEGNLAFFYDHWGYHHYDVVVQLDADHIPAPGYLAEMVRPFSDPAVGYVAAPSVCDTNAADSWAARGRLFRESRLHGPVQLGSNGWLAPVCIGSHYAVRTAALRDVGGIGPELAEDFSTTYLLCATGWQGAFALDAEARGEGPPTFAAMLTQEFQWSRSLTALFLGMVPRHLGSLPLLLRVRFLCALCYYPTLVCATAWLMLFPPVASWADLPWDEMFDMRFITIGSIGYLSVLSLNVYLRRRGFLRPTNSKLVGWELVLFVLTRWPTVGLGVGAALVQRARPRPVTFKVTVKGDRSVEQFQLRLVAPFIVLCLTSTAGSIAGALRQNSAGYVTVSLVIGLAYLTVLLAVPILHAREASRATAVPLSVTVRTIRRPLSAFALLLPLYCVATAVAGNTYLWQ